MLLSMQTTLSIKGGKYVLMFMLLENEGITSELLGGKAWTWCWFKFHDEDVVVSGFKLPMVKISWKSSPLVVVLGLLLLFSAVASRAVVSNMNSGSEDEKRWVWWWSWAEFVMGFVGPKWSWVRKSSWLIVV